MSTVLVILAVLAFVLLAAAGRGYQGLVLAALFAFGAWWLCEPGTAFAVSAVLVALLLVLFGLPALRRSISAPLMKLMGGALPSIGETESIALQAGTVWWERELFSGSPQWQKLLGFKVPALSAEEQAFLDGPVTELCAMLDDEAIAQSRELPQEIWDFLKQHRFLGMVISKEHGGLGFSAAGHAAVITRIATVSLPAAITVMVPNSLGPGELLHHYGTEAQKQHYLPRLAEGLEIPCFALTEPHAGSDAANGRSHGVVCRGMHEGREVLGIRLNFNKRYITLAPVATVIGLAFYLRDPDQLLGGERNIGITCALLPRATAGMEIGEQHDPMGIPFPNGPVRGRDVFIPMDWVIGGQDCAGAGWRMLMECLSVGRSISLPSLSVGAAQFASRSVSAYSAIREQFGLPIARFEGVREAMAEVYSGSYWMSATRNVTCGAIDSGEKPSVLSAIVKYYTTEEMRTSINHAMDIFGGAAICRGPRNLFSRPYSGIPIAITVEGANILTRSLIIFGQGAMRCHPFLLQEISAIQNKDLRAFDKAFFSHVNHVVRNTVRSLLHGLSGGRLIAAPQSGKTARHYRRLSRLSTAFAFAADMGLLTLAGSLKRKEYLSGRYADALAWLYIASATLKRFHDEGEDADWPLVEYTLTRAEYEIEHALYGVIANFPSRFIALFMRLIAFPFGRSHAEPDDRQVDLVVDAVLAADQQTRRRLSTDVYIPAASKPGLGALEAAYEKMLVAAPLRTRLEAARRKGELGRGTLAEMIAEALGKGLITEAEQAQLAAAEASMDDVIQVDYFAPDDYRQRR